MLPHVVRFNGEDATIATVYTELVAGTAAASNNGASAHESLAAALEGFMDAADLPRDLAACGVDAGKVNVLSEEAAGQWTASFNPRDITAADFTGLYSRAFGS